MCPVIVYPDELSPWDGPYPYFSWNEPRGLLLVFHSNEAPSAWKRYTAGCDYPRPFLGMMKWSGQAVTYLDKIT
jgi:hypothetical protein